jgi:hypothetical protein
MPRTGLNSAKAQTRFFGMVGTICEQGRQTDVSELQVVLTTASRGRDAMICKSCTSKNHLRFSAEINVHFGGWAGLSKPGVLVFPKLLVCMDCGFTEFAIPEAELARLASRYDKTKSQDGRRAGSGTGNYAQIASSDLFDDRDKMDA